MGRPRERLSGPGVVWAPMSRQASTSPRHGSPRIAAGLDAGIRRLPSSYFALVMATGVVAIVGRETRLPVLPTALGALNVAAYAALWALTLARLVRHRRALLADLFDHANGPGFFTVVAATGVLGSQFVALWAAYPVARALWVLTLALWTLLTFAVFAGLTIKASKPDLARGITGGWLLAVVATQSVVVLAMEIVPAVDASLLRPLWFLALSMWLWGGMLYVWLMALIFHRYVFHPFSPEDLTPPYWINMGAMAISTLAGTFLIAYGETAGSSLLAAIEPVLKGVTVLFWATGTWWIPMLVVLGAWRHLVRRFPLRYDPAYWGMVFPLGMYALCDHHLAAALDLAFLEGLSRAFVVAALVAWSVTFLGLLRSLATGGRREGAAA